MRKNYTHMGKVSESLWRKAIGTVKCQPVAIIPVKRMFYRALCPKDTRLLFCVTGKVKYEKNLIL
jgi:hypothetical protein